MSVTTIAFTARSVLTGEVGHVFDVLTDWPRQTAWVPATVVARPDGGLVGGPGERLVATTSCGPLVLVDPMEVLSWEAPALGRPGRVDLLKTGDVFGGEVRLTVAEGGAGRVRIEWHETVVVHPRALSALARWAGPLPGWAGKVAFETVLRRARRDLAGSS